MSAVIDIKETYKVFVTVKGKLKQVGCYTTEKSALKAFQDAVHQAVRNVI